MVASWPRERNGRRWPNSRWSELGAVELRSSTGEARVTTGDVVHRVRVTDDGAVCTCAWYAKHRNERGPCKHVLAVSLASDPDDAG